MGTRKAQSNEPDSASHRKKDVGRHNGTLTPINIAQLAVLQSAVRPVSKKSVSESTGAHQRLRGAHRQRVRRYQPSRIAQVVEFAADGSARRQDERAIRIGNKYAYSSPY